MQLGVHLPHIGRKASADSLRRCAIQAEELGVTQANIDSMKTSTDPDVRRLVGAEPGLGKALGLDEEWAYRAIKVAGNYGESFDRNLGKGSPIGLERGLNDLWTRGGMMYAMPLR